VPSELLYTVTEVLCKKKLISVHHIKYMKVCNKKVLCQVLTWIMTVIANSNHPFLFFFNNFAVSMLYPVLAIKHR